MKPKTKLLGVIVFASFVIGVGATIWARLIVDPLHQVTTSGTALVGGPFTLVATDGAAVSDQTYRGKWEIIYFGYTFCPDACPVALTKFGLALEKLGPDASKLQAIFVTVDPQRDTRQVMADYLKSFDSRIVGVTGTETQIDDMTKEYRVYVARHKSAGGDYIVDHSAYFYLMNTKGQFVDVLDEDLSGEEIAARLRKQMDGSSG